MRLEIWCKISLSGDWCLCTAPRTRNGACYYWIGLDWLSLLRDFTPFALPSNRHFFCLRLRYQRDIRIKDEFFGDFLFRKCSSSTAVNVTSCYSDDSDRPHPSRRTDRPIVFARCRQWALSTPSNLRFDWTHASQPLIGIPVCSELLKVETGNWVTRPETEYFTPPKRRRPDKTV